VRGKTSGKGFHWDSKGKGKSSFKGGYSGGKGFGYSGGKGFGGSGGKGFGSDGGKGERGSPKGFKVTAIGAENLDTVNETVQIRMHTWRR